MGDLQKWKILPIVYTVNISQTNGLNPDHDMCKTYEHTIIIKAILVSFRPLHKNDSVSRHAQQSVTIIILGKMQRNKFVQFVCNIIQNTPMINSYLITSKALSGEQCRKLLPIYTTSQTTWIYDYR